MTALVPRALDEALELRAAHPEAIAVAGGTDLWVEVNAGRLRPRLLLDLSRVDELATWERNGSVFLGAGMTFARIIREHPDLVPLVEAARSIGSAQIRNRATIGGNLATASPAGDSLPVLAAYGADVVVASTRAGRRTLRLDEFLTGPKRTSLAPDELIVGVQWTPLSGHGSFIKVGRRNAMAIAVASSCLQVDENGSSVRLALGAVAPTVIRAREAERFADGADWSATDDIAQFGRLAAAAAEPIDDLRGSAAYRRHAVEVLARRALERAQDERC